MTTGSKARQLWGYAAAAEFLALTPSALRNLVHRRVVPHVRIGPRCVRFDQLELEAWLRERRQRPERAK